MMARVSFPLIECRADHNFVLVFDDSSNIHRVSTIWWNIFVSLKLVVRRTQLIYVYLCYWNCCISRDDETPNPTPSECLNYVESCFEALSFDLSRVLFIWPRPINAAPTYLDSAVPTFCTCEKDLHLSEYLIINAQIRIVHIFCSADLYGIYWRR
jgi:hypothetical protein